MNCLILMTSKKKCELSVDLLESSILFSMSFFVLPLTYFSSYSVVNTLKDYAIKALVNTVDYLGSVTYKVSDLLDEKVDEVSGTELCLSCIEQVITSYFFRISKLYEYHR